MKVLKVKKLARKNDEGQELWDYCWSLQRKYRSKYSYIDILCDADSKNNVEIKIGWSSIGSQFRPEARKFAQDLLKALDLADKIEADIKSKFPDAKIVK